MSQENTIIVKRPVKDKGKPLVAVVEKNKFDKLLGKILSSKPLPKSKIRKNSTKPSRVIELTNS